MDLSMRPAVASDSEFLTEMLVAAAFWRPAGPRGTHADVLRAPELAHYVDRWPRAGDVGVVAETDRPIGAAWLRFFPASDPGYGFVAADIPEVSIGVRRQYRGQGVGRSLLGALISAARGAHLRALSLSVELDNPALRLYRSTGFSPVTPVEVASGSLTMRLDL